MDRHAQLAGKECGGNKAANLMARITKTDTLL